MSPYKGNQPRADKDAPAGAADASTNASREPMNTIATLVQRTSSAAPLALAPLNSTSLRDQAYALLKNAIADTDIYDPNQELRLDERQLTTALGVSRTPIREALSLLEQEGFIRTIPRRGIYIIRKSKREMIEMIQMWAALESMAARLATLYATDAEIATLRHLFDEFQNSPPSEHLDEYSDANIAFHTAVIALGGSQTIVDATRNPLHHRSPEDNRGFGAARHRVGRTADPAAHPRPRCTRRSPLRLPGLAAR